MRKNDPPPPPAPSLPHQLLWREEDVTLRQATSRRSHLPAAQILPVRGEGRGAGRGRRCPRCSPHAPAGQAVFKQPPLPHSCPCATCGGEGEEARDAPEAPP